MTENKPELPIVVSKEHMSLMRIAEERHEQARQQYIEARLELGYTGEALRLINKMVADLYQIEPEDGLESTGLISRNPKDAS